jgi:hypothetical protein
MAGVMLQGELAKLLKRKKPSRDRLMGLLFIAGHQGDAGAFESLIEYDKGNTLLLVGDASNTPVSKADKTGKRASRRQAGTAGTSVVSSVQQQEAHLQQLEQLLLTCLTSNHVELASLLIAQGPALALLGESYSQVCSVNVLAIACAWWAYRRSCNGGMHCC